jgi:peptidoglycan/xylan/chitin deacetylase (PgdA/CDA1 family)
MFLEKNTLYERPLRTKCESRVLNLTFHGVGQSCRNVDSCGADVWLSIAVFELVLDLIKERKEIVITLDDGNKSDLDIVLPLLLERGMKAAFFVCPEYFDKPGYLTGRDVQCLSQSGMIIGSHGMHHYDWRKLKDKELFEELSVSKKLLEQETGQVVSYAACPKGSYDRRVLRFLRAAGYERVYTSDTGYSMSDAWLQTRTTIHSNVSPDILKQIINQHPLSHKEIIRKVKGIIKRWR